MIMVELFIIISLARKKPTKGDLMHPKQICTDVQSMGAKLVLDGDELFIENPEKIYPEIEDFIKSHKVRIIKFLKGDYTDKEHAVRQTIDKIIDFYHDGCPVDSKINKWLQADEYSLLMVMNLTVELAENGWKYKKPITNYEDDQSDQISKKIYERAIFFFKKGAVMDEGN